MKKLAIVTLSGGMDSAVCLAITKQAGYDVAAMHVNYGQLTESRELEAFNSLCKYYDVQHKLVVDLHYLAKIGGSSLTDSSLELGVANLDNLEIPNSYVPFRNANIMCIAVSWAEVLGASAIVVGAVHEDSSGYPDTRPEFFSAFEKMLDYGTKPETKIEVLTPIINLSKEEIVLKGVELKVPFELTWSCYQSSDLACGKCDSCALRLRGFSRANFEDPLLYKIRPIYK